jgi:diguanylate cyclase (GGDEF)-like protein
MIDTTQMTKLAMPNLLRTEHQLLIMRVFLVLGMIVLLVSALADVVLLGKPHLALFECFFGLLSIVLYWYATYTGVAALPITYIFVVLTAFIILTVMFWLQPDKSVLMWGGFFPLVSYFLLGLYRGTLAHILFMVVFITLIATGWHNGSYQLDARWMINLVETQIAYGIFGYMFAYTKKVAIEQVTLLSTNDTLTGIMNRKMFVLLLKKQKATASRMHQPLSVIMVDIDYFKKINDQYGHLAGDAVLTEFVHALQENLRENDLIFRWGGEEFMILLPNQSVEEGSKIAEKLRYKIAHHAFSIDHAVTASFGITEAATDETDDETVCRLDHALYRAKELGRNRIETLQPDRAISCLESHPVSTSEFKSKA